MKEQEYEQINHPNGVTTWKTKPKEQPEALRLADALDADQQGIDIGAEGMGWGPSKKARTKAADELRRLHALNQELLEALKMFVAWSEAESNHKGTTFWERVEMLRKLDAAADTAIAKVESEK